MILSNKGITKVLIRLRGYAGWSVPFNCFHTSKTGFIASKSISCPLPNSQQFYIIAWAVMISSSHVGLDGRKPVFRGL